MRRGAFRASVGALGLLLAGAAHAAAQTTESLNRAGSGARAAGMGDAFVSVSDDGTAASWNPAGLAQLRQPEFSVVYVARDRGLALTGMRSRDDLVSYSGTRSNFANASVDFASAALPLSIARKPVTLQAGWHRLYQLGGSFGGDVDRVQTSQPGVVLGSVAHDDRVDGNIDVISAAGAVKLSAHTALGGSIDFWRGDWTERISLAESPGPGGAPAFLVNDSRQRVRGHNFTAGLLLTYPSWSAGLVYHSPFWSKFHLSGASSSTQAPSLSVDVPNARFRFPRSIGAGVSHRLAARWMVTMDLTQDQWTDALVDGLPGQSGPLNFFDSTPPALSTTRDTVSLNAGAEHLFVRDGVVVPVRFGLGWEPQGGMDPATRDPLDYFLVSAGAGYNTNRVKFDAAVQYRTGSFRSGTVLSVATFLEGGVARDAIGRADTHEWRVKVSAIYRIQDTDKLRAILRRIFG
jgi:long-subunit fatty acid transport protein